MGPGTERGAQGFSLRVSMCTGGMTKPRLRDHSGFVSHIAGPRLTLGQGTSSADESRLQRVFSESRKNLFLLADAYCRVEGRGTWWFWVWWTSVLPGSQHRELSVVSPSQNQVLWHARPLSPEFRHHWCA